MITLNYFYFLTLIMLNQIYKEVAEELQLPKEVVKKAYISYWKFVKETISELPLKENLTEDEFNSLKTNFNIPSLGKLNCTYDRFLGIKERLKYIKGIKKRN